MSKESIKIGLFAYELVQYAVRLENNEVNLTMLNHYKKATKDSGCFDKSIGDAVTLMMGQIGNIVFGCFEELDNMSKRFEKDFEYHALNAVSAYFPTGYTHGDFLGFCAMLTGVALLSLEIYENVDVLCVTAEIIQAVLTYFTMISDFDMNKDMPELIRVSRYCCRKLRLVHKKII